MKQIEAFDVSVSGLLISFVSAIKSDTRIGPMHISLYMALLYSWHEQGLVNPIYIFSSQLMPLAKISGLATYHRTMRQLAEYGYVKYVPSYYHLLGSLVYLPSLENKGSKEFSKIE
jgi:hypothetical protein